MPRVLTYSTCAILRVVGLVVECGECESIASRLLGVYFLSYVFRVSENIVVFIYKAV